MGIASSSYEVVAGLRCLVLLKETRLKDHGTPLLSSCLLACLTKLLFIVGLEDDRVPVTLLLEVSIYMIQRTAALM